MNITKTDVISVAFEIGIPFLREKQLEKIVAEYEFYQKQDPTATWNLVVEQQIYNSLN